MVYANGTDTVAYNAQGKIAGEINLKDYNRHKTAKRNVLFHKNLDAKQVDKLLKEYLASPAQSRAKRQQQ